MRSPTDPEFEISPSGIVLVDSFALLTPLAFVSNSRAKRLGVMVTALPLLALLADAVVGRRCWSAGAALNTGVDTEADRTEDEKSGEE